MDFKDLASNLGFDEEDFNELLHVFLMTSFSDIEKISIGLKEESREKIAQAAHSIKGAASNLGLDDIALTSKDMEMTAKDANVTDFSGFRNKIDFISKELKKIENAIKTD